MRFGACHCRQHEIADAEQGQSGYSRHSRVRSQHEQEDLDNVVKALEVVKCRVGAQNSGDDPGQLVLPSILELL